MKTELVYQTAKELPIYAGSFEVQHKDCPFLPLSRQIEEEISLDIVTSREQIQEKMHTVRFSLRRPITRSGIESIKNILDFPQVKKMIIWADGITKVELNCREKLLDTVMPITLLTFGDIQDYKATMESEEIRLISPSLPELSGKERLLKLEEEMKEYGDAELTSFHQFTAEDLTTRFARIMNDLPLESWINYNDIELLNTAYLMGYFEIPRRCELKDLSKKFDMSVTTLHGKLRSINRVLAERFLDKSRQALPP